MCATMAWHVIIWYFFSSFALRYFRFKSIFGPSSFRSYFFSFYLSIVSFCYVFPVPIFYSIFLNFLCIQLLLMLKLRGHLSGSQYIYIYIYKLFKRIEYSSIRERKMWTNIKLIHMRYVTKWLRVMLSVYRKDRRISIPDWSTQRV